jgi:hypothetical protein
LKISNSSVTKNQRVTPASEILQDLLDRAPAETFTLNWLMEGLHKYSFGLLLLLLAFAAAAPGINLVAGLLLIIPACEMIIGRPSPFFPRWISERPLRTKHLHAVVERAVPILRHIEKVVRPRLPTPPQATKRIVGTCVVLLSVRLVIVPIPLSNVLPAFAIALISLAYLEEDGLVLAIGLLAGLVMLAFDASVVWQLLHHAQFKFFG